MPDRRPRHDRRAASEGRQMPADAELGARLESALRDGLRDGHVDVAQLLRDTRQASTRRTRVRRVTMIAAAAVAVGVVPVSLQAARWMSPPPVTPGTGSAPVVSPPTTPPTPSVTPVPSEQPSPSATQPRTLPSSGLVSPEKVLYEIPDGLAFARADFSIPMESSYDSGQYRRIPTVQGQACNEKRFDSLTQPVAGRAWTWAEENSNRLEQVTVDLNVTGWVGERTAELQLSAVRRDRGACRFDEALTEVSRSASGWVGATTRIDGIARAHAVRQVPGGVLVAVTVTDPAGEAAAVKTATMLAETAARRAESSGLTKVILRLLADGTPPGTATDAASAEPANTDPAPPTGADTDR
jgi:hypothetical protein